MTFDEGLALHQAGRLTEARGIYRRVLESEPRHADALHLAGAIAYQTGNFPEAVELIGKAIVLNPAMVAAYSNLGLAQRELRRPDEALDSYDRALALKLDAAAVRWNRALCHLLLGDYARGWERSRCGAGPSRCTAKAAWATR